MKGKGGVSWIQSKVKVVAVATYLGERRRQ
jgi:hypothetical protein